jgi:alpha-beta hydrolase superfamily lysophospholipase
MPHTSSPPRRVFARALGWAVRLLLIAAVLVAVARFASKPAVPDAFYEHPLPADAQAGTLLSSAPFTHAVPPAAKGWRILYVTLRGDAPAMASAVVVLPSAASDRPRPVIAWAHGTTGVTPGCAPSVMDKPFDNLPGIARLVDEGWAYVGSDYPGLGTGGGHTYLVGEDAARAVLDSVRAARQLPSLNLDQRIVVWGHSQGGHSALWAGSRASTYAPELKLLGVAALAPASDLHGLISASKSGMFGKIVSSFVVRGYAQSYPDVSAAEYVSFPTRLIVDDIATRCVGGYATLFSVLQTKLLPADGVFSKEPTSGALGARLRENTPTGSIPAPVLIAQGAADDLVVPEVQKRYVQARCADGQAIDLRIYDGRDHISVVAPDGPLAPELFAWTRDRFDGKPAADTCKPRAN